MRASFNKEDMIMPDVLQTTCRVETQTQLRVATEIVEEAITPGGNLYAFGSAECDQFHNENDIYERKKPLLLPFFNISMGIRIIKITCGSQHSLILSEEGKVYSFGNSDDGCLGRNLTEKSTIPGEVKLSMAVDLISAGDTHSVAANSITGVFFIWGAIKSTLKGKLFKHELPEEKKHYFLSRGIQDLKSGDNHIVILSNGFAYTWGDNDTGALGTVFRGELEEKKIFQPNALGIKKVRRIFVGKNVTFIENSKHQIFACGLNNYGQLGIKPETHDERWTTPQLVPYLDGSKILDITGGEHHTLILNSDYQVFGAGRNDDGQIGEYDEEFEKEVKQNGHELDEHKNGHAQIEEISKIENESEKKLENEHKIENESKIEKESKIENEENFGFKKIKGLPLVEKIFSSNHFNFAREKDSLHYYSWGFGSSYTLANGKEDSVFEPFRINNEKFWANKLPTEIALGFAHVVFTNGELGDKKKLQTSVLSAKKRKTVKTEEIQQEKRMPQQTD